ncbi:VanZ family protein [Saccharopolyspora sp. NPDC047091]|uniref:VanZ family protein n=1 Tax=Saccharopolyspora sp. NPDC047091 TaxID=3155924 RepID=UPI0033EAFAB2
MIDRVTPAVIAVVCGVLLAVLLFVPFVAREYRWRGGTGAGRMLVVLGFIVHCWALMTYTLLPLPEVGPGFCADPAAYAPQLEPLHFLADFRAASGGLAALMRDPMVGQALLNIALFVPLGMFVRHLFRSSRIGTVAIGFATSLLIETTQLTGVWFLYPCAYRLFDVDDLLMNTLGAVFGLLLAPVLELVGGKAPTRPMTPRPVTAQRRLLGMACDVAALVLTGAALHSGVVAVLLLVTGAPSMVLPDPAQAVLNAWLPGVLVLLVPTMVGSGGTLGQRAVLLRPALPDGALPGRLRLLLRVFFGSGQYVLLVGFADLGPSEVNRLAVGFALLSAVAVWFTAESRGISAWLAGLSMMDTRMPRSKFRKRKGDPFTPGETILVGSLPTFEPGGRDLRDLVDPRGVGAHRRPDR